MKNVLMKNRWFGLMVFVALYGCNVNVSVSNENTTPLTKTEDVPLTYLLPSPQTDGQVSVEKTMAERRSQRSFQDKELSAEQLSQILWAAYGITEPRTDRAFLRGGFRTAPSAGALYPFEIYAVVGKVKGIEQGVYRYTAQEHKIERTIDQDIRTELRAAALGQAMVEEAPLVIVYSAIFSRMTGKYGERGRERYVCIDLGHSAQNIYLQAGALRLGTCAIGAFVDGRVAQVLQLSEEEEPLYLMPVGYYYKKQ